MDSKLSQSFEKLASDSMLTLLVYVGDRVKHVRFFSYGSNMNKKKFKADMEEAAEKLELKLSKKDKDKLELDKFAVKRVLLNFKRELSNESKLHGRAFSIYPSLNNSVEGICHNIAVSVLPVFLKKEGLCPSKGTPSYKLIRVNVLGENKEVLTLLGLKPIPIEHLKLENKIKDVIKYVEDSIKGAESFGVEHTDMTEVKKRLLEIEEQTKCRRT
jgi:hypothetical protein